MANLPKPPVPSRQVTPALEQVDAVAAEAVWVKRAAHECERAGSRSSGAARDGRVEIFHTQLSSATSNALSCVRVDCAAVECQAALAEPGFAAELTPP